LRRIGLKRVRVLPTQGNPIVYASWQHASERPTVLIYGHYDVLPGEPLDRWNTPPFRPVIKGLELYGRGASDDKGQLFCHVKAIESYLRTTGALPLNIKCVFEGDEEVGSPHLLPFLARHPLALRADAAIASDTRMLSPRRPAISFSQRGGLRAELEVRGPKQELHSGTFGGAIRNPVQGLCEMLASLHDEGGRIAIPGFYDDVREWSKEERAYMARTGPSDEEILRDASVRRAWGEVGFSLYERTTIRPALILNGIAGGHQGPGVKGVIPTRATAKLSFRLVPDQDPERVARLLCDHLSHRRPGGMDVSIRTFSPVDPAVIDRKHPAIQTAVHAYQRSFGALPVFVRSGGSIPSVGAFQKHLGIPTVLMGFGLPGDRIHAANERFHLPNFYRGIEASIWYLAMAAKTLTSAPAKQRKTEYVIV